MFKLSLLAASQYAISADSMYAPVCEVNVLCLCVCGGVGGGGEEGHIVPDRCEHTRYADLLGNENQQWVFFSKAINNPSGFFFPGSPSARTPAGFSSGTCPVGGAVLPWHR